MTRRSAPAPQQPEIVALRLAAVEYERAEEQFRNAVELERLDDDRRRFSRNGRPAMPVSTPGAAERHGRELAERLPDLARAVRTAIAAAAKRPRDRAQPVSAVAREVELLTVGDLITLARDGWRDPWAGGRHGRPSAYDPPRAGVVVPRRSVRGEPPRSTVVVRSRGVLPSS